MESEPVSPVKPQDTLNIEELTAFQHITSFNLFVYSRDSTNLPLFLLYKAKDASTFTHCSGIFGRHDPNIYFSMIREFITQNRGLLYTPNLKHLRAESANPFAEDFVLEEDLTGPVRPQKGFSKPIDDICRLLSESPYIFQDQNGCVTFFVEYPLLSLEAINEVSQKKGLDFIMRYYTFEEMDHTFEEMDHTFEERVNVQNEEICEKLRSCLENSKLKAYIQRFIVDAEPIEYKERYAIISCEPKVETYMMHSLHYPIYKKHGEHWSFYRAFKGEFPTDEEIKSFKGILIPGSSCSAYADNPWYKELFKIIRWVVNEQKQINLLGICFGAQITAQALGGRVEKMKNPFIRGGDILKIKSAFYKLDYIKKSEVASTIDLHIAQSHGDHIAKLPPGAVHHGSSVNTNVETYTIGNNVLAFQGHPEYNEAWTAGAFYRLRGMQGNDYDRYADEYMKEKFSVPITREELTKICYTFLKKDGKK